MENFREMTDDDIGPETIERWALSYLGRYATSAENLRRVLVRRLRRRPPTAPEVLSRMTAAIDALVSRYEASGLLSDAAYAEARARSWHRRGAPGHQIRARLRGRGVAPAVAAEAVAKLRFEVADPDLAAACAFARRRRLGPYRHGSASPVDHLRELAAFARAGFDHRAARAVLACADVAAVEELAHSALDSVASP